MEPDRSSSVNKDGAKTTGGSNRRDSVLIDRYRDIVHIRSYKCDSLNRSLNATTVSRSGINSE